MKKIISKITLILYFITYIYCPFYENVLWAQDEDRRGSDPFSYFIGHSVRASTSSAPPSRNCIILDDDRNCIILDDDNSDEDEDDENMMVIDDESSSHSLSLHQSDASKEEASGFYSYIVDPQTSQNRIMSETEYLFNLGVIVPQSPQDYLSLNPSTPALPYDGEQEKSPVTRAPAPALDEDDDQEETLLLNNEKFNELMKNGLSTGSRASSAPNQIRSLIDYCKSKEAQDPKYLLVRGKFLSEKCQNINLENSENASVFIVEMISDLIKDLKNEIKFNNKNFTGKEQQYLKTYCIQLLKKMKRYDEAYALSKKLSLRYTRTAYIDIYEMIAKDNYIPEEYEGRRNDLMDYILELLETQNTSSSHRASSSTQTSDPLGSGTSGSGASEGFSTHTSTSPYLMGSSSVFTETSSFQNHSFENSASISYATGSKEKRSRDSRKSQNVSRHQKNNATSRLLDEFVEPQKRHRNEITLNNHDALFRDIFDIEHMDPKDTDFQEKVDSLTKKLRKTNNTVLKIKGYMALFLVYEKTKRLAKEAMGFYDQAENVTTTLDFKKLSDADKVSAYLFLNNIYKTYKTSFHKDRKKQVLWLNEAKKIVETVSFNNPFFKALVYINLGNARDKNNTAQTNAYWYHQVLTITQDEAEKFKELRAQAFIGLGNVRDTTHKNGRSGWYHQVLTITQGEEERFKELRATACMGLGNARDTTHGTDAYWYHQALRITQDEPKRFKALRAQAFIRLGNAEDSNDKKAEHYKAALTLLGEHGSNELRAQAFIGLGYARDMTHQNGESNAYWFEEALKCLPTADPRYQRCLEMINKITRIINEKNNSHFFKRAKKSNDINSNKITNYKEPKNNRSTFHGQNNVPRHDLSSTRSRALSFYHPNFYYPNFYHLNFYHPYKISTSPRAPFKERVFYQSPPHHSHK
jgi:hypothetical protein